MRSANKLIAMGLALSFLAPLTGCVNNLMWNMWVGFGQSIGAIPGTAIGGLIADLIGLPALLNTLV